MKKTIKLKSERGVTGVDITVAVIIIILFVSVITGLLYNIYAGSIANERNVEAHSYLISLFQKIDTIAYEQVIEDSKVESPDIFIQKLELAFSGENVTVKRGMNNTYPGGYLIEVSVTNYNEQDGKTDKQDWIKIIEAKVTYRMGNNTKTATSRRLKIREQQAKDSLGISPKLAEGMIPVKYIEQEGYWQVTDSTDPEWFDYQKGKWANIMLSDGSNVDSATGKVLKEGSMFVYIPRFAYKIENSNYHTGTGGQVKIKFLNANNTCKDGSNITIQTSANSSVSEIATNSTTDYILHPAFTWSTTALEGIWVAKYEASRQTAGTTSDQIGTGSLQVKKGVTTWRNISILDAWQETLKMNATGNMYGLKTDSTPGLISNAEWDATCYLARSVYGKNEKIGNNTNSNMLTGVGGNETSTTGNVYGIYDLAGGTWEYVLGYLSSATSNTYVASFDSINSGYKTVYQGNSTDAQTNYNANHLTTVWEYSSQGTGNGSWDGMESNFLTTIAPFFIRGGIYNSNNNGGELAYRAETGDADPGITFRPSIIVK